MDKLNIFLGMGCSKATNIHGYDKKKFEKILLQQQDCAQSGERDSVMIQSLTPDFFIILLNLV